MTKYISAFSISLLALVAVFGQPAAPPPSEAALKVVILGSGGSPQVDTQRYGPAILVEAGGEKLLFDCGRAAVIRLAEAGVALREIDKIFLTHLHSDHILSLPDFLLSGWTQQRNTPLRVWGPSGTKDMMNNMVKTFDFDIHLRRDVDEKVSKEGITVAPTEGVVYERSGVKVTAFLVDHGPVKPAFGYRIDAGGRSVALSGDTRLSENLIGHATGVDVLIHEVFPVTVEALRASGMTREQAENIVQHHTSPAETGIVFDRTKPRLAIYAHGGGPAAVAAPEKTTLAPSKAPIL
jgi:ribonuclease Z